MRADKAFRVLPALTVRMARTVRTVSPLSLSLKTVSFTFHIMKVRIGKSSVTFKAKPALPVLTVLPVRTVRTARPEKTALTEQTVRTAKTARTEHPEKTVSTDRPPT